jgi:hypothetical protein
LHAARVIVGLSRESLADRAGFCRHSIRKWKTSSDAIPGARYGHLCRVVDILESEGARSSADGVHLQRSTPVLQQWEVSSHLQRHGGPVCFCGLCGK